MDLISVFLQADNHFFPAIFVEEAVFSPSYVFGDFVKKKKSGHSCVDSYPGLYSVPLVFISFFVPVPCCFYCYGSVV
jgi:hypothetical protein